MALFDNQIMTLFSWDLFRQMASNEQISVYKLNLIMAMLVKIGIPFDLEYASGTRKEAASMQLTVHINPTTTIVFVVQLEPGATAFTPSP